MDNSHAKIPKLFITPSFMMGASRSVNLFKVHSPTAAHKWPFMNLGMDKLKFPWKWLKSLENYSRITHVSFAGSAAGGRLVVVDNILAGPLSTEPPTPTSRQSLTGSYPSSQWHLPNWLHTPRYKHSRANSVSFECWQKSSWMSYYFKLYELFSGETAKNYCWGLLFSYEVSK